MRSIGLVVPKADKIKSTRFGIPLGVLYLASVLKESGWQVSLYRQALDDCRGQAWKDFVQHHSFFGVSIPGYSRRCASELIYGIRELRPNSVIIVGGADITLLKRIPPGSDWGIVGEGEDRIVGVLENLYSGDLPHSAGVIDRFGEMTSEKGWPFLCNPENLPYPARDLVQDHKAATTILTARGCSCQCIFCARPQLSGRQYRPRSVASVLDELEYLQDLGYRTVAIIDDNFLFQRTRVKEIMEGVIGRNIHLELSLSGWAREVDQDLYVLMRQAGVRAISFGLESGVSRILALYKKPIAIEMIAEAINACDKAGIFTVGNFIFGAPSETIEDMQETLALMFSLPLDTVKLKVLGYTHGSQLWFEAHEKGLVKENEFNVFAGAESGLSPLTTAQIMRFCHKATQEFHSRSKHQERLQRKIRRWGFPYSLNLELE